MCRGVEERNVHLKALFRWRPVRIESREHFARICDNRGTLNCDPRGSWPALVTLLTQVKRCEPATTIQRAVVLVRLKEVKRHSRLGDIAVEAFRSGSSGPRG